MRCANCKMFKYCDNSVTPPNTPAHKNKFPYYDIIAAEYLIWIWWCKFQSLPTLIFRPSPPSWSSPAAAYALCAIMYGRWVGGGYIQERPPSMALNYTVLPFVWLSSTGAFKWHWTILWCHVLPSNASANMGGHPCIAYMMMTQMPTLMMMMIQQANWDHNNTVLQYHLIVKHCYTLSRKKITDLISMVCQKSML